MNFVSNLFLIVFTGLGVYFGFFLFNRRRKIVQKGHTAKGKIVNFTGSGNSQYAVVEFKTSTGQLISKQSVSKLGRMNLGDTVLVYYDPANPSQFTLNLWYEKWMLIFIMIVPLIFCIIRFITLFSKK